MDEKHREQHQNLYRGTHSVEQQQMYAGTYSTSTRPLPPPLLVKNTHHLIDLDDIPVTQLADWAADNNNKVDKVLPPAEHCTHPKEERVDHHQQPAAIGCTNEENYSVKDLQIRMSKAEADAATLRFVYCKKLSS